MGMIEWYQQGGADSYSDARKAKLKKQAAEWLELLNEEYEDGNRVGANTLYQTIREKYPEKGKRLSHSVPLLFRIERFEEIDGQERQLSLLVADRLAGRLALSAG